MRCVRLPRGREGQPRDRLFTYKGSKWQIFRQILREHWDDWRGGGSGSGGARGYQYIWFPDDDLELSAKDVDHFLDVCEDHEVCLAQPSLMDQYVTHDIVKQQRGSLIRYTNFVEIQGPVFQADVLEGVIWPTLKEERVRSAWGLDYVWSHLLLKVYQQQVRPWEVKMASWFPGVPDAVSLRI